MRRFVKVPVLGMSKDMKTLKKSLEGKSSGIITHMMRLYKYPENDSVNHWKSEIFNFIHSVPTLKDKSKYPDKKWPQSVIWDSIDYNDISMWERGMIKKYGQGVKLFTLDFYDMCYSYIEWLSEMLSENGDVSRDEVYQKLEELGL